MANVQSSRGSISGINVTPLVDVTLVLLVVFIVTAKIVVAPALPMDLPPASQGEEVQIIFSVLLPKDGRILVNGAQVADLNALVQQAREAQGQDPELRVVIQADGDVPHREVIAAMDSIREAGVSRIAFATLAAASNSAPAESEGSSAP